MNTHRQNEIIKTKRYLYDRLSNLSNAGGYDISKSLTQQIQAISIYSYSDAANGQMNNFLDLLKDADIADLEYGIAGSAIWLPNGVKYKNRFVSLMSRDLVDHNYDEYVFPNLINPADFQVLNDKIYDFDSQALKVSAHNLQAVLAPTGEAAIYPVVSRWLREGKELPLRIFQSGPYFRYKSSPNAYLRPIECSFMLEAHGIFSTEDEMNAEFKKALLICERWAKLMCLDTFVVSRPIEFNKPVSEQTVGYDVLLPNGKTIQAVMAYLQSQIFSKPYEVKFKDNKTKTEKTTEQITFGITERSIYTALFVHVDDLGLRLQSALAPEQVSIVCREQSDSSLKIATVLLEKLKKATVRASIKHINADSKYNPFEHLILQGTPLQLIIDDLTVSNGYVELFDRRSLGIQSMHINENISKKIKRILSDGDNLLLQEQKLKKANFIEDLNTSNIKSLKKNISKEKKCIRVTVHDNISCINFVQGIGLGEYIGTDILSSTRTDDLCLACGTECKTFGYISKRL